MLKITGQNKPLSYSYPLTLGWFLKRLPMSEIMMLTSTKKSFGTLEIWTTEEIDQQYQNEKGKIKREKQNW